MRNDIISEIIEDIKELNGLDNKTLTERVLKFNEEYGEFCAEVCKFIGITHKPYDRDHLAEEMADAMQNLFSVYLDVCSKTGITIEEVLETILVKNKKWREKAPLYTKNVIDNTPELDIKLVETKVDGGPGIKLTVRNCFYNGFIGKSKTIYYWLISNGDKTFKQYLDSPVTYDIELNKDIHAYHSIDAEKEMRKLLKELNK